MNEVKGVPKTFMVENNYSPLVHSTLKLFNALPVDNQKRKNPSEILTRLTIMHGFVFSPQICANYTEKELREMIELIEDEVGINPTQMNSSFHKSWKKVRDAPLFQLMVEQAFHYMTTYGYEQMGIYNPDSVFIPNEKLQMPELSDGIKLTVIKGYTKKQLKEKMAKVLQSGIALKSVDEFVRIAEYCEITTNEISEIKNKEVRVRLYNSIGLVPHDPVEFLRLVVFRTTEKSLIITNNKTIRTIKESTADIATVFADYDKIAGYRRLAEIFLRHKRLFLAMKSKPGMRTIINRISTLSHKYHKPLQQPIMNNITGLLKKNEKISMSRLKDELAESNIFRKIRLLHALNYRISGSNSILYKVRNGKGYSKELEFENIDGAKKIYDVVLKSIVGDLSHLKGKKIYIPNNIKYALPATEKQFTGNMPSGSSVTVPRDMIFGVYWENVNGYRIDIDLSVISIRNGKIGWNARARSDNILFSGDVTDAPNGATELFYVNKHFEDTLMMYANYFNYTENLSVPLKVIVAGEHPNSFGRNYMVDPNHIQCVAKTDIDVKQKILGIIKVTEGECTFYFSETALGDKIASSSDKHNDLARDYLSSYTMSVITLNDVLEMVGAKLVEEKGKDVVDLSPEVIEKDSFIRLLTKQ